MYLHKFDRKRLHHQDVEVEALDKHPKEVGDEEEDQHNHKEAGTLVGGRRRGRVEHIDGDPAHGNQTGHNYGLFRAKTLVASR